jgi:PTH1 family peptidyl-tRNA hydrolase
METQDSPYIIIGLGNPGREYRETRHNLGFMLIDRLCNAMGVSLSRMQSKALVGLGKLEGQRVVVAKPQTYMNRSGQAVLAAGQFYKLELEDLMVVVDDHALPLGRIRIRKSGSSGGHNGLEDIVTRLGSDAWSRLRVGIDEPVGDAKNFVLSGYEESEIPVIKASIKRAADAVECWVAEGPDQAMNRFNVEC